MPDDNLTEAEEAELTDKTTEEKIDEGVPPHIAEAVLDPVQTQEGTYANAEYAAESDRQKAEPQGTAESREEAADALDRE